MSTQAIDSIEHTMPSQASQPGQSADKSPTSERILVVDASQYDAVLLVAQYGKYDLGNGRRGAISGASVLWNTSGREKGQKREKKE